MRTGHFVAIAHKWRRLSAAVFAETGGGDAVVLLEHLGKVQRFSKAARLGNLGYGEFRILVCRARKYNVARAFHALLFQVFARSCARLLQKQLVLIKR